MQQQNYRQESKNITHQVGRYTLCYSPYFRVFYLLSTRFRLIIPDTLSTKQKQLQFDLIQVKLELINQLINFLCFQQIYLLNKMRASLNIHQHSSQLGFNLSKSGSMPMTDRYYRFSMFQNTLTNSPAQQTKQQQKFRQYMEESERDLNKYIQVKEKMKQKFFKIRTTREHKLHKPPPLRLDNLKKYMQVSTNLPTSSDIRSERTYKVSNSQEINNQIAIILESSLQLALASKPQHKPKVKSISEIQKKSKQQIDKEKSLIMNFVKKSSSVSKEQKKWEDLTNRDKYLMNFLDYLRKKTRAAIESDVYEKQIKKKSSQMEKFQDFILEEVKFSADHKEKLSHFFKQIRGQFKRVEQIHERSKSTELPTSVASKKLKAK